MLYTATVVLVRFNPANYTVTEGVDSNAVITLETIGAHIDVINVIVIASNGNATRGCTCTAFAYQFSHDTFLIMCLHACDFV